MNRKTFLIAALAVRLLSAAALTAQQQTVTIGLTAKNISFDKSTITVPAGAEVVVHFDNQDNGIPHNFAVFHSQAATNPIFQGEIVTGPRKITYRFTAPSRPGSYFFRCDVHPTIMTGQFIVK